MYVDPQVQFNDPPPEASGYTFSPSGREEQEVPEHGKVWGSYNSWGPSSIAFSWGSHNITINFTRVYGSYSYNQ